MIDDFIISLISTSIFRILQLNWWLITIFYSKRFFLTIYLWA